MKLNIANFVSKTIVNSCWYKEGAQQPEIPQNFLSYLQNARSGSTRAEIASVFFAFLALIVSILEYVET